MGIQVLRLYTLPQVVTVYTTGWQAGEWVKDAVACNVGCQAGLVCDGRQVCGACWCVMASQVGLACCVVAT
jgi:hypothetical protein